MATSESEGHRRGSGHYGKWAGVAAVLAGLMGIAVVAVVLAGTQLVSSPMATAGTTRATPWVPRPIFVPKPVPHPKSSVGASGTSPAAAANPVDVMSAWAGKATAPLQAIQQGMTELGNALNAQDVGAMKKACAAIDAASGKLGATLPSPKQEVTAEAQAAVDEIGQMYTACVADPPDVSGLQTHGNAANQHMEAVVKLVNS